MQEVSGMEPLTYGFSPEGAQYTSEAVQPLAKKPRDYASNHPSAKKVEGFNR
jgi:hypothetical protein